MDGMHTFLEEEYILNTTDNGNDRQSSRVADDEDFFKLCMDNEKDNGKGRCGSTIVADDDDFFKLCMDHEKEKNPLNLIKQLPTEEVEVVKSGFDLGEEDTRGIKHCGGQYAKVLPKVKEPVTSGENDPIQFDDTESVIMVTMESQANNGNIKDKSQVALDDVTATDRVLAITEISDGVEKRTREGEKITNICLQNSDNVTTTGGGGNSYGFKKFLCILSLVILCFDCVRGKPIVDLQSDLVVYGETLYLKCSINDSIPNETYIWSRRIGQSIPHTINFDSINTTDAAKFKIIDGGSTLGIKNLNEKDITYCYYCRGKTNYIPSNCTYILEHNNIVVLPPKTAVTFPMNEKIIFQSECYPNLTFFMIIQNRVVAKQTATKKDNNSLYEVDMTFNGTWKKGEQFLVVAHHENRYFTVYISTDDQITKHKDETGLSGWEIFGVVVGVVVVVILIAVCIVCACKKKQAKNDENVEENFL